MENVLVTVPGAILHFTGKDSSVHLASGDLTMSSLGEGDKVVVVLARVRDEVQWPLAKDLAVVKLDQTHYFFTLQVLQKQAENGFEVLNYGLAVVTKGQEKVLRELDRVMAKYSFLSKEKVKDVSGWEVLDGSVSTYTSPEELKPEEKREVIEEHCRAYWITLAPNVESINGYIIH